MIMEGARTSSVMTEEKAGCSCGATRDDVELKAGRSRMIRFWQVRCARCGRETAKHMRPDGALREWNHPYPAPED